MAKIPKTPHKKPAFWSKQIKKWQNRGLSQVQYCTEHGLKKCTFHYWKQKLSKSQEEHFSLLPVTVLEEKSSSTKEGSIGVRIRYSDRLCVELSVDFDASCLKRAIEVLEQT